MNDNELNNNSSNVNTYRAMSNLNTAIENPQINMNSAMGVNIKDVNNSSSFGINSNGMPTQSFENNQFVQMNNGNDNLGMGMNPVGGEVQDFNSNIDSSFIASTGENQFIPTNVGNVQIEEPVATSVAEPQVMYQPVMEQKKKKSNGITIPKELMVMLFIVFILFVFILVMPYFYDFFRELQMGR